MIFLKQSTAVVINLGPFVAYTDAVTLKTGLVSALDNASTGVMISKNAGTFAVRHAAVTATTYDAQGMYKVTLDATDTNTLGRLRVCYLDATSSLPVWRDFHIVPAAVYDCLISGTDYLPVNVNQWLAVTVADSLDNYFGVTARNNLIAGTASSFTVAAADKAKVSTNDFIFRTALLGDGMRKIASYNSSTGVGAPDSNWGSAGSGTDAYIIIAGSPSVAFVAADFADGLFTASKFAADFYLTIWAQLVASIVTANSIGARIIAFLTGDIFARAGAPVGASLSADLAAVKATLGAPASGTVSADVAAVSTKIGTPITSIAGDIAAVEVTVIGNAPPIG